MEYYQRTEDLLLRELLDGHVVHIDETKINILAGDQYVWVLTDNRRVVFRLQPSRETEFLKPLFSTFKGTIVTDFYGGYDALPCTQQKCLVHLIRDLNDDLWKNPFDDELEEFVAAVGDLLVPILHDVQRFGLKARHLHKHRIRVDRFYRDMITGQASTHDTTARYRKRFERYKESLFSFIENDGVPWHNNAAERALRHLAVQRKISGTFTEKGASDYLRLLAIAQTCRFQQKSFLGFLLCKSTTNTEIGAEHIQTGLPTLGKKNDAHVLKLPLMHIIRENCGRPQFERSFGKIVSSDNFERLPRFSVCVLLRRKHEYSAGDLSRIKPTPSPRVTALSVCGQSNDTDTLSEVRNPSDERMLLPSLVGNELRSCALPG